MQWCLTKGQFGSVAPLLNECRATWNDNFIKCAIFKGTLSSGEAQPGVNDIDSDGVSLPRLISTVVQSLLGTGLESQPTVATSLVLRWMCDSPRTGCAWRTTPFIHVARTSNNRVIMACELYCCLLSQCEALRICRSGFPIATLQDSLRPF